MACLVNVTTRKSRCIIGISFYTRCYMFFDLLQVPIFLRILYARSTGSKSGFDRKSEVIPRRTRGESTRRTCTSRKFRGDRSIQKLTCSEQKLLVRNRGRYLRVPRIIPGLTTTTQFLCYVSKYHSSLRSIHTICLFLIA